jgi:hypothetical protein
MVLFSLFLLRNEKRWKKNCLCLCFSNVVSTFLLSFLSFLMMYKNMIHKIFRLSPSLSQWNNNTVVSIQFSPNGEKSIKFLYAIPSSIYSFLIVTFTPTHTFSYARGSIFLFFFSCCVECGKEVEENIIYVFVGVFLTAANKTILGFYLQAARRASTFTVCIFMFFKYTFPHFSFNFLPFALVFSSSDTLIRMTDVFLCLF